MPKKIFKTSIISFFFFLVVISCVKCPAGVKIGEAHLSDKTKSFLTYTGDEVLVFKDIDNNILELQTTGLISKHNDFIVEVPCNHEPTSTTNNYVDMETKEIIFENDSVYLSLYLGFGSFHEVKNPSVIDSNYVEIFTFRLNNKLNNIDNYATDLITNFRGKTLTVESEDVYTASYNFYENKIILNKKFSNVYADKENKVYFTKDTGIVGFSHQGIVYCIDQ
jgi:hypothetical protein